MNDQPQVQNPENPDSQPTPASLARHPPLLQRLRKWMRKHWFVTTLIAIYLVYKCLGLAWHWVLTPSVNPNPQDSVTISGTFPFDKGFDLYFTQSAHTTTPWVNNECGRFTLGAGMPCHGGHVKVAHKKLDSTHYEVTFYRDYYLPGIAGWTHSGLGYTAQDAQSTKPGAHGGFPNRTTAVKCRVGPPEFNRDLACLELDKVGPDIYDPATRHAKVDFNLLPEFTPPTKGN
jgi:hypothetical protein